MNTFLFFFKENYMYGFNSTIQCTAWYFYIYQLCFYFVAHCGMHV